MKYLVLLIGDGDMPAWDTQSPEEQGAAMQRFVDFDAACEAREGVEILAEEALSGGASATVMTTRSGKVTLTEGPYAEAVEGLGGFFLMAGPTSTSWWNCSPSCPRTTSRSHRSSTRTEPCRDASSTSSGGPTGAACWAS